MNDIMVINRILPSWLLSVVIMIFSSAAVSAAEWQRGFVGAIDPGKILVVTSTEGKLLGVSSSTLVTLNGRPARLRELHVGDAAIVMYLIQGANLPIAQRIEAYRQ